MRTRYALKRLRGTEQLHPAKKPGCHAYNHKELRLVRAWVGSRQTTRAIREEASPLSLDLTRMALSRAS